MKKLLIPIFALLAAAPALHAQSTPTVTTLYSFPLSANAGNNPSTALVEASDGNFYGTTENGGPSSTGTIFTITPQGLLTTLYTFGQASDGGIPRSPLLFASDGNLYGMTYGNDSGAVFGTVYRITMAGAFTTLRTFSGVDGDHPQGNLIQAADGNIYATTSAGGDTYVSSNSVGDGTVMKITPAGAVSNVVSLKSSTTGRQPLGGLLQARDGNFYGSTTSGSTDAGFPGGGIFKLSANGVVSSFTGFKPEIVGGFLVNPRFPNRIIQGSDDSFYGTTSSGGDAGSGTIFKTAVDGTITKLHSFGDFYRNSDGNGAYPLAGLVQATDGNFYGTTQQGGTIGQGTIFKITPDGVYTTIYSFTGSGSNTTNDGSNPVAALIQGRDGNLYGTTSAGGTSGGGTIFRVDAGLPAPLATTFTVNGSSDRAGTLVGPVLSFSAKQAERPAGLHVRVQFTSTPEPNNKSNTSWTDLPTNTGGRMTLDVANNKFVLNTTCYPQQQGLFFRAVSSAHGYPEESISNYVGTFNAGNLPSHLPPVVLEFTRQGTEADFHFTAGQSGAPSDVTVRIQSSTTPGVESSWTDLADGQATPGLMRRSTIDNFPDVFKLLANKIPPGEGYYFRAVASRSPSLNSISNIIGAETVTADIPPTVTITPSNQIGGTGTQADPFIFTVGQIKFKVDATPDPTRHESSITSLKPQISGRTILEASSAPAFVDYTFTVPGGYDLEAVAVDDMKATGRAGTGLVYIRVIPSGDHAEKSLRKAELSANPSSVTQGHTYRMTGGGRSNDPSTWVDTQGHNGIPGPDDLIILDTPYLLQIPQDAPFEVGSVELSDTFIGPPPNTSGKSTLKVGKLLTIFGGVPINLNVIIEQGAKCELLNSVEVSLASCDIQNFGGFYLRGTGNVRMGSFTSYGETNFRLPISIPLNAATDPTAGARVLAVDLPLLNNGVLLGFNPNSQLNQRVDGVISNDGGSLISQDGGSLISQDGGGLISDDGLGLISQDGGGLISQDGGGLIGKDGSRLVATGAGNLVATGAGNITAKATNRAEIGAASATAGAGGYTQAGGNTDLSAVTILGAVTLNGGVLSGSGTILGDLMNNGGYIAPGHSAGVITVTGAFAQGAGGTLILENGGARPDQFDQLSIGGSATLGGKLDVKLINGYTPNVADTFNPLSYSSVTGQFAAVTSNTAVTVNGNGLLLSNDPAKPSPVLGQPRNISTRAQVLSGDSVMIGGFIIAGSTPKTVVLRAIAPSLTQYGVAGALADPTLDLYAGSEKIGSNDDWKIDAATGQSQEANVPKNLRPQAELESVIVKTLQPNQPYTAIVRGKNGTSGVALVEVYDTEISDTSLFSNISTRGVVGTGDNVMIGGFIIAETGPSKVVVRAVGPSLTQYGVAGALQDPILRVFDGNGNVILQNDDWQDSQGGELLAANRAPSDPREPAVVGTLVPGSYTAVVTGKDNSTGVALVEVYDLQ